MPVTDVRELFNLKRKLDAAAATVWLTTTEIGLSLTDEDHMCVCPKDIGEGKKTNDRFRWHGQFRHTENLRHTEIF